MRKFSVSYIIKLFIFIITTTLILSFILNKYLLPVRLHVFAPWSFEIRLRRIIELYEYKFPFTKVKLFLGTPGKLIKEIDSGAKPDVYIAMGPKEIEILRQLKLVLPGKEKELLKQTLVLAVPDPPIVEVNSLAGLTKKEIETVGIGRPRLTAGIRTRKALEKLGILEIVDKKSKTSPLKTIVFKEAEAAIIYEQCAYEEDLFKGELTTRKDIKIVQYLPSELCEPFAIVAVPLRSNFLKRKASIDFVNFLGEESAQEILYKKATASCPVCELGPEGMCILPQN
ncbi:MAG: substrate-binding domain-containing protein [Candidatus Omnitrophica bacterium]|nr:substrate-binding domain-containing protein [Candidatus Omnitrophota bacterium]